jgi:hypothetical protein
LEIDNNKTTKMKGQLKVFVVASFA